MQQNLTPNESAFVLWIAAGLLTALIFLVLAIWRWMFGKLNGMGDSMNQILLNQALTGKDVAALSKAQDKLEEKVEDLDEQVQQIDSRLMKVQDQDQRLVIVENKLKGFAAG